MNGLFIPLGGGDPIPLLKDRILIGRRSDCDIRLAFPNVSGRHCELRFERGAWVVRDLNSTNGIKVNGTKVEKKRLMPGDEITIARRHNYRLQFELEGYGTAHDEEETEDENLMAKSLLERAGLQKSTRQVEFDSDIFDEVDDDEPPVQKRYRIDEP